MAAQRGDTAGECSCHLDARAITDNDELQLRRRVFVRCQVDRHDVHDGAVGRQNTQGAELQATARLIEQRSLPRENGILLDDRMDLPGSLDLIITRQLEEYEL